MKSFITSTLLLLALLLPATATAFDFEVDGIYYNINGNEATVTKGDTDYAGDVTIPTTVTYSNKTYPVTAIGDGAFYFCTGLTSVTIPNSVYTIGFESFYGCTGLTDVIIPNSVTTIRTEAFRYCSSLKHVYCYITDPSAITMGPNVFYLGNQYYTGRTLHVPYGTADAYQADWNWFPFFERIAEMGHVYGDVNGDDEVNIADVNAVIDVILGSDNAAADVNGDDEVNIADVNAVIDVILGDGNVLDIAGMWYSEYFVDEDGKYDIAEDIAVYFTFNRNKTGHYSYRTYVNNEIVDCIIELRWSLEGQRLYIWYNDGDYEELYCTIDENGYLLLSLYKNFMSYTAYRPIYSPGAARTGKHAARQGDGADAVRSASRAIKERMKTED